jgi:hypothetical protein
LAEPMISTVLATAKRYVLKRDSAISHVKQSHTINRLFWRVGAFDTPIGS